MTTGQANKPMKVVCVYSTEHYYSVERPLHSPVEISFGIASIATALMQAGYDVRLLVVTPRTDIASLIWQCAAELRPALFCLTAVSSQYELIRSVAREVRQNDPAARILLGGHHATLNPERVIEAPEFDAICVGEGERAVVAYARQLEGDGIPSGIANLWLRTGGGIERNQPDDFIQDLDSLPFVNREIWREWIADAGSGAALLLGRGCPNRCSYCSNHALCRIASGRYVRFRSPSNVIGELRQLVQDSPGLERVYLEVETLGANLEYTFELCAHLAAFNRERERPLSFGTNLALVRKIAANEELLIRLKEANFAFLNIGLESGSERVRQEILRRPRYSNGEIISFCRLAASHGLAINLYVLIGVPGETLADFRETVAVARSCMPANVSLSIFQPYPGTDLYTTAMEMGLMGEETLVSTAERRVARLDLPGFSRRQIQWAYITFYYRVFRGSRPLADRLAVTVRTALEAWPAVSAFYHRATKLPPVVAIKRMLGIGRGR